MYEDLKQKVFEANLLLPKYNLVVLSWGNVSQIDRNKNVIGIKPSGVNYETLRPQDIVIVDHLGKVVEGELNPSTDTPTHLKLYQEFPDIGGIVHTHSKYATIFAQAHEGIPCLGTTHADVFNGMIPLTREINQQEVGAEYEKATGQLIISYFQENKIDPKQMPGILVSSHGPFCWAKDAFKAVENAMTMEVVAEMALNTKKINNSIKEIPNFLLDKHYQRKNGNSLYYGQA